MIYRAIAFILGSLDDTERVVFIEATTRSDAHERMSVLLSTAWRQPIDRIDYHNLDNEYELMRCAFGEQATGDARLLEIGWSDGWPRYAETDRTQFLVGPCATQRMAAAQRLAAQIRQAGLKRGLTATRPSTTTKGTYAQPQTAHR